MITHIAEIASPICRFTITTQSEVDDNVYILHTQDLLRPVFIDIFWFAVDQNGELCGPIGGYESY